MRQFVDDKSVANCQQTCCKLIVKTCYPQACCKLFQQVIIGLQMISCNRFVEIDKCVACNLSTGAASRLNCVHSQERVCCSKLLAFAFVTFAGENEQKMRIYIELSFY